MSRENITDILCIGCQKGSTSWLHSVLNSHPKTHSFPSSGPLTSTDKEAHFWDWNHKRGVDWYRTLMTPPNPAKLSMDFTPEYAFLSAEHIAECKALNPTAKVIYILRDPMARAVSALRMHMLWRYGKDHAEPLHRDEEFLTLVRNSRITLHGAFLHNLRAWQKHYPDMMVLNYEDFHNDRAASVARIFAALDLDTNEMNEGSQRRVERLVDGGRVWESEKFPMDRSVLMFLQGLTCRVRQACESELNMRFAEGEQLLNG
ncbi:sulfotransferase family protein [Pararhodobacter zhoushanensis]|uniref:sulfotransferase family protein n=1 Tax=Pararhodobacter zhoushanensis TaxID=2479545 RepID=UPI000F8DF9CE|nr:sulfotransferase domain-containing protein [Pararhodobacter zhoushanensis]